MILQRNCHEFIAYENLHGVRKQAARTGRPMPASAASAPLAQAVPLVRRALKILADREVSPQTGLLKSTLLQLDSTFSERNYGASSFLDFVEKLAQAGVVTLKHAGRSVMVELNEGFDENALKAATPTAPRCRLPRARRARPRRRRRGRAVPCFDRRLRRPRPASADGFLPRPAHTDGSRPPHEIRPAPMDMPAQVGDNAEGVPRRRAHPDRRQERTVADVSPQRETDPSTDRGRIRRASLRVRRLDGLLKACQREGFVRIERDRRGGLRVFQGPQLQGAAAVVRQPILPQPDVEDAYESQPIEIRTSDASLPDELPEIEESAPQPDLIDTTAELLGRAKPKPRRARRGAADGRSGQEGRRREEAGGSSLDAREKVVEQQRGRQLD